MLGAAHLNELPFEALIGLLEEREENSPCHAAEAHPEVLLGALSFKEVKEDVDGRGVPKVVAQYGEGPHEGPTVGMLLGGGHVDLHQQHPLEAGEGETQLDPFKDGLVKEEEGLSFIGPIVGAHWFTLSTGANRDIGIAFSPKDAPFTVGLTFPVFPHVPARVESRDFSEKLNRGPGVQSSVICVGWRVESGFCSSHLEESLKNKKKKEENEV